jgi:hypothetical protein
MNIALITTQIDTQAKKHHTFNVFIDFIEYPFDHHFYNHNKC